MQLPFIKKQLNYKVNILKYLISFLLVFIVLQNANGANTSFEDETLKYVITYKWGLINKDAGDATVSLKNHNDTYHLKLTGKTKSWADKFYKVRDTLISVVDKKAFRPISYTRIAHEKDKFGKDVVKFSYSGNVVKGDVTRLKQDKKGKNETTTKELQATGSTFDLLSVFYFLRTLNYSEIEKEKEIKTSIFSGSKVEELTIKYLGKEKVKLQDKTEKEAYHIIFRFTTGGKKKSSDDIDSWISTDSKHIPLLIVGSLPIGQIKCYYQP